MTDTQLDTIAIISTAILVLTVAAFWKPIVMWMIFGLIWMHQALGA